MIPKDKICLKATHYSGKVAIFTKKQQQLKSLKRPDLRNETWVNGRMRETIETPTFVYEDLARPKKRQALYLEEYRSNDRYRYTKVIVEEKADYFFVVTAFRPDYVKERGKTKLLFGKDNENT